MFFFNLKKLKINHTKHWLLPLSETRWQSYRTWIITNEFTALQLCADKLCHIICLNQTDHKTTTAYKLTNCTDAKLREINSLSKKKTEKLPVGGKASGWRAVHCGWMTVWFQRERPCDMLLL